MVANIETVSMNSNLEALNRNPTEGSFESIRFSASRIYRTSKRSVPLVLTSIAMAMSNSSVG